MIKDELKKYPPGDIGGKFEIKKIKVSENSKNVRYLFYFEEDKLIPFKEFKKELKLRNLTIKEWHDYHYLLRDENGEYIYPKCKYCGKPAVWHESNHYYTSYCENHHSSYVSEIQSIRAINQHIRYGNNNNSLKGFIERHGEEVGKIKYERYRKSLSKAKTLDGLIEKYGEEEGTLRHKRYCMTVSECKTLDGMIKRYGREEGIERYNQRSINSKRGHSLDGYIEKYGEKEGKERYNNMIMNHVRNPSRSTMYSKISKRLFDSISERLQLFLDISNDVFYGRNEFLIYGTYKYGDTKRSRFPDFFIKSMRLIIEFQGNHWHERPKSSEFLLSDLSDRMENSIVNDYNKLRVFRTLGYEVFYVHENEYRSNPDIVIEECIKFITNKEFRDEYTRLLDLVL